MAQHGLTGMQLRPYQRESLDALYAYWRKDGANGLIVLPTGAGKSLVLAALCHEILDQYPNMRIGVVTHVRELITQNYKELLSLWPAAPAGIYSAGIGRRDIANRILLCGIQSTYNKVDLLGSFDILIVDEAHLISRNTSSMYGKFIANLRQLAPDMRLVGLTATAFRLDTGRLDYGKGRLFDKVVYEAPITKLIEQGYLSPLLSKATATQFDISQVQKRGGEYVPEQLEVAVDQDWITQAAAREIVQYGTDRKSWLAFCAGVNHAIHMRGAIQEAGASCEAVYGEMPKARRDHYIEQFRQGQIQCLTSVGVLGIGFNVPQVDLIALLRPTASAGLFVQQVGRGLRCAPDKKDALILDFARNTARHGPIDSITAMSAGMRRGEGEPLTKDCPDCLTILPLAVTVCFVCGYLFPRDIVPTHQATADATTSILSKGKPQWVQVDDAKYYRHEKDVASMRVEYSCGFIVHKEWVCFEHRGFARQKAVAWWAQAAGTPTPNSVKEALERQDEISEIHEIQVQPDGKYFAVTGRRFKEFA